MRTRIRCPWHNERTASLVRRKSDWYCYGACQKAFTHAEVESRIGEKVEYEYEDEEREDLAESLPLIRALPSSPVRGFSFPADDLGYYIVWPDGGYYKKRLYNSKVKYIGPRGHKPPLFWVRRDGQILSLVEGEINALSVAKAMPEWAVASPGSASMFNSDNLSKALTSYKAYAKIVVILDDDPAGLKGLIESKAFFLGKHPFVDVLLLKPDPNEVLVESGTEALREKLQRQNPR